MTVVVSKVDINFARRKTHKLRPDTIKVTWAPIWQGLQSHAEPLSELFDVWLRDTSLDDVPQVVVSLPDRVIVLKKLQPLLQ